MHLHSREQEMCYFVDYIVDHSREQEICYFVYYIVDHSREQEICYFVDHIVDHNNTGIISLPMTNVDKIMISST